MSDVTVTSPVSRSVFFTAEEVVELWIVEVVAMVCDAHLSVPEGLGFIGWGRFGGKARTVLRIDWEIFADDDVGGSATRSWINSAHSRSRSYLRSSYCFETTPLESA